MTQIDTNLTTLSFLSFVSQFLIFLIYFQTLIFCPSMCYTIEMSFCDKKRCSLFWNLWYSCVDKISPLCVNKSIPSPSFIKERCYPLDKGGGHKAGGFVLQRKIAPLFVNKSPLSPLYQEGEYILNWVPPW